MFLTRHTVSTPQHSPSLRPARPDRRTSPHTHAPQPDRPVAQTHPSDNHQAAQGIFSVLMQPLQRAVAGAGYSTPTPIQQQAIPHLLKGRDLIGCAQTGTGKTAAFTLPILQYLAQNKTNRVRNKPRVLVLTPTRELAAQIGDSIKKYGRHLSVTHTVIFGGVGQGPQVDALRRGLDIVVATPGRLLDLKNQGHIGLQNVEMFVLDEADRMLDMGFIHDIRAVIAALPAQRQSLFFSATMEAPVVKLARTLVKDPVHVSVAPEQPTVEKIDQKIFFVDKNNKDSMLISLLKDNSLDKVIVFTKTKFGADKVVRKLISADISAAAIHGNKSQTARTKTLANFKQDRTRVLVATDIAARGIDVDSISHVINYDLPNEPETYIHRIGRTARAGAGGDALSFCSADERDFLRSIESLIRKSIPVDVKHAYHSDTARYATGAAARPAPRQQQQRFSRSARPARSAPSARSAGNKHSRYRSSR